MSKRKKYIKEETVVTDHQWVQGELSEETIPEVHATEDVTVEEPLTEEPSAVEPSAAEASPEEVSAKEATMEVQPMETTEPEPVAELQKKKKKAVKRKNGAVKVQEKEAPVEERLRGAKLIKELIRVTIFSTALGVFCFALTGLGVILWGYWSSEQEYKQLNGEDNVAIGTLSPTDTATLETETEENGDIISVKPDKNLFLPIAVREDYFKTVNADYRFYLHIPGTAVSYPVVMAHDLDHYLRYTFSGQENMAGSIAIDYRVNDSRLLEDFNTIISGHNRQDGTMFSGLVNYTDEAFRNENSYIYIVRGDKEYVYEVFAATLMPPVSVAYNVGIRPADYLKYIRENTVYKNDYGVTEEDRILTLYTCNEDSSMRYLVHAVLRKTYDIPQ